ncbi:hypothetical protein BKA63DRAFT_292008 [Paraphoma chrysanthemicola]|nr:hypothetical protein BKA63DRAFT_292008 [Paraphoma chrysanthemicola]
MIDFVIGFEFLGPERTRGFGNKEFVAQGHNALLQPISHKRKLEADLQIVKEYCNLNSNHGNMFSILSSRCGANSAPLLTSYKLAASSAFGGVKVMGGVLSPRNLYSHCAQLIVNPISKFVKNIVQGLLKSCGAVVARRSYMFRHLTHMTHPCDADAVGSNPTRTKSHVVGQITFLLFCREFFFLVKIRRGRFTQIRELLHQLQKRKHKDCKT